MEAPAPLAPEPDKPSNNWKLGFLAAIVLPLLGVVGIVGVVLPHVVGIVGYLAVSSEQPKIDQEQPQRKKVQFGSVGSLTFDQMAREANKYAEQSGCWEGKVVQRMDGQPYVTFRIDLNGDYNQTIITSYDPVSKDEPRILEGDSVEFCGVFRNLYYASIMNVPITLPAIRTDVIRRKAQ